MVIYLERFLVASFTSGYYRDNISLSNTFHNKSLDQILENVNTQFERMTYLFMQFIDISCIYPILYLDVTINLYMS